MSKKCSNCGGEYRLTILNGKFICLSCEADVSLENYGVVTPIERGKK
jgi:DNA-directed RNA polymerase subunit RPC12/RpoP